ncbi:zinc finger HIT domain-containing protein 1-like isoform X3 [Clavelina lepadiformis]|uniref:zinc finger HIT domain-containing protein 1-like isoform X3 n=1 Tax=Clavelina lepadiformis TaxID=159417 RepID=UPI004041E4CE
MTSTSRRESSRLQEINSRRILDTATRQRRLHRQLEALEKDNFQEDPLENIQETPKTKRPKFGIPSDQELENEAQHTQPSKKKKRTRGDHFKQRFRKTFAAVLEEQRQTLGDSEDFPVAIFVQFVDFSPATLVFRVALVIAQSGV